MPPIADKIDAAIGAAPPEAPALDSTLVLGRRALRRRRLAYGVGAAATALVIGGTAWAVSPDDSTAHRSDDPAIVDQPSIPATPPPVTQTTSDEQSEIDWLGDDAVMLDGDGGLLVKTGWTVVRRIDEVNGPGTIGVDVRKGRRHQWFLFGKAMTISSLHAPSEGYATFQEWIDVNGPLLETRPGSRGEQENDGGDWPGVPRDDLVAFGEGEALTALAGVTIVEQRPSPDVGESFATADDVSAVALVEEGGERWYVLARDLDGPAQYIAVPGRKGGPDLDAFLELARERYAEGGGGLL